MYENVTRARLVQVIDATGAPVHQQLAERSHPGRAPARPVRHDQVRQLQQFLPLVPLRQAQESVHADDQAEAPVRVLMSQFAQGLDRIRRSFLADFAVIDQKARLSGGCQLHHLEPQFCIRDRLIPLGRIAGGQEAGLLQSQRLLQLERRAQMSVVNRIEGTAKNADRIHRLTLPESGPACKAPANAPVSPVITLQASPGAQPLMTRSAWPACRSRGASGKRLSRPSSRTNAQSISVGSTPSLFKPKSTLNARGASPAAAASASWKTS